MPVKPVNSITITAMISFNFLILFFFGVLELPSVSSSVQPIHDPITSAPEPFTDLVGAFRKWDSQVGYPRFRQKHGEVNLLNKSRTSSLQEIGNELECGRLKSSHVSVLVKGWTWIPDNLDNLYSCRCGLSCLWTQSSVLAWILDNLDNLYSCRCGLSCLWTQSFVSADKRDQNGPKDPIDEDSIAEEDASEGFLL